MSEFKLLPPSHLDKLIQSGKPVYVLNTSVAPSGDKGTIVINFYDGNRREFFKMPPTFIPMAVSDAIPVNNLKNSRDFKQSLLKGMLTLVDPDSAEEYLSTQEAQDEYEALVLSEHSSKAHGLSVESQVAARARVSHQANPGQGPVQDVSAVDTVSNKVRGLIESHVSKELSGKQVLTALRRHQTALTPVDLSYVMQNSTDTEVVEWSRKALGEATKRLQDPQTQVIPTGVNVPQAPTQSSAFDFDNADSKMTPEEVRADAEARARAMATQATQGQSKIPQEIDKLMKGG